MGPKNHKIHGLKRQNAEYLVEASRKMDFGIGNQMVAFRGGGNMWNQLFEVSFQNSNALCVYGA